MNHLLNISWVLLFSTFFAKTVNLQNIQSPCPNMFKYLPSNIHERDRWYGEITVTSDVDLIDGVFIVLVFDGPSLQLGASFGKQIIKKTDTEYLLRNLGYVLKADEPLIISFYVIYDVREAPPNFVGFRLNAVAVCPENKTKKIEFQTSRPIYNTDRSSSDESSEVLYTLLNKLQSYGLTYSEIFQMVNTIYGRNGGQKNLRQSRNNPDLADRKFGYGSQKCGKVVKQPVGLIVNGEESLPGEFPWHAAIYGKGTYTCGGSLISDRHVLTAAHCAFKATENDFVVHFGRYTLFDNFQGKTQQRKLSKIFVHPKFTQASNDIAVLRLSSPVEFTETVSPICLWSRTSEFGYVQERLGTVVGFGRNENGKLSDNLMKAQMPIVSIEQCIDSYSELFGQILSTTNFCAGYRNGTSVCNGDSGGGLVFKTDPIDGAEAVWEIRGVVSVAVPLKDQNVCDPRHYVVFTDVAKYLDWINEVMNTK